MDIRIDHMIGLIMQSCKISAQTGNPDLGEQTGLEGLSALIKGYYIDHEKDPIQKIKLEKFADTLLRNSK